MTATTRTDIAAFLTAQLDADEAAARAADPLVTRQRRSVWVCGKYGHVAVDPARVLAQVAALRAVVELHANAGERTVWDVEPYAVDACAACGADEFPVPYPCATLRALASIWKDAPEFDAGWAE